MPGNIASSMQVINPELHNMMRVAGKSYMRYHSPLNASVPYVGNTLLRSITDVEVMPALACRGPSVSV